MAQRILLITSSLFGEGGQSSALAASFKSALEGRDVELVERNVVEQALPHLTGAEMTSWMTEPGERSADQQALARISDDLLAEVEASDVVVLAVDERWILEGGLCLLMLRHDSEDEVQAGRLLKSLICTKLQKFYRLFL